MDVLRRHRRSDGHEYRVHGWTTARETRDRARLDRCSYARGCLHGGGAWRRVGEGAASPCTQEEHPASGRPGVGTLEGERLFPSL